MAETPTMEVRARLTAETAQFTKGMQQASSSMEQFTQNSARLRAAMTGIGVASAAVTTGIIAMGTKAFLAAARVDELDVAMNAVGESTGKGYQAIRDAALAIKANGIEMEIAQKSAIKFAQNNLELTYASDLARAAQDLAVVSAKNSSETFDMLTHAVITGRSEVLKSVGIQKSAGQMYEDFAKKIGKTAQALTYQERQQAIATGALEEAKNVAGAYEAAMQSPGKVLRSFARITNEIQVSLGGMLLKGIGPIIFHMYEFYKTMARALESSVAFRTVMEALKQVLIKITTPITNFFIKMKGVIEGLTQVTAAAGEVKANFDPVGQSVKDLASKIEFMLPAVAALAAVFATFAGAQVFGGLPIIGRLLGMLSGPIGLVVIGLTTLFFTSNQIKEAMTNLFSALSPLIGVVAALGQSLANAAGYGVSILAVGINALATVIRTTITFLRENRIVLMALTSVLVGIAGAMLFFKIQTLAAAAATKYSNFVTGLKIRFLNAQAVADAKANIAQAQSTFATRAKTLATVQAIAVERQLAVAQAMSNLATIKSTPASAMLGSKRVAVATATKALVAAERALVPATAAVTAAQSSATVAANSLAAAQGKLALASGAVALPLFIKIALLVALVSAFVLAWKNSETFREVMTKVFNAVAKVVGAVIGFVFEMFGNLLIGFGELIDTNHAFGKVVSTVFNFVFDAILSFVSFFIKAVKYIVDGFVNLMTTNKTFASVVENVLNFVTQAFVFFYTFFYRVVKFILDAFVSLFDVNKTFGSVVSNIVNFVTKAYFGLVSFIVDIFKTYIDTIIDLIKNHQTLRAVIESVINVLIKIIGHGVTMIVVIFANIIKAVATIIYYFEKFRDFIADVWGNVVQAIQEAAKFIGNIFSSIGNVLAKLTTWMKDKFADLFEWLADQATKIPDWLGGGKVSSALNTLAKNIRGVKKEEDIFESKMGASITAGAAKAIDLVSALDKKIITASKSWGNYEDGAAGAVSGVANRLLNFAAKVTEFSSEDAGSAIVSGLLKTAETSSKVLEGVIKGLTAAGDIEFGTIIIDNLVKVAKEASTIMGKVFDVVDDQKFGTVIIDGLVDTAKVASKGLEIVFNALAKIANADFGTTVVDKTSEAAIKAGNLLIGLASGVKSFTSEDFVSKAGEAVGDLIKSLKTGLGFGDILGDLAKEFSLPSDLGKDANAEAIENQTKRADAVREAMQSAIDSIKNVLDDLKNAARAFADSLKDTIVGFAGLKSIELPDGFIPKAKSLIDNMNQRLNKSMQFASQIAQLQSMNLNAGALKDIIEAGPVRGAQLAASILGGGQAAVDEISSLQKAIEFSGAVIGQMGSDAAFGGLIANAESKYASVANASLVAGMSGTVQNIQQGAFQINIDTRGAADTDEQIKMITDKIQETFAILARELAAK